SFALWSARRARLNLPGGGIALLARQRKFAAVIGLTWFPCNGGAYVPCMVRPCDAGNLFAIEQTLGLVESARDPFYRETMSRQIVHETVGREDDCVELPKHRAPAHAIASGSAASAVRDTHDDELSTDQ